MPSAAGYHGLNVSPDYAQRRRDSMANITIATRMRDDAIGQLQDRMKTMGLVAEQMNETAQTASEMLPADKDRFLAEHEKLMQPVVDELGKYNNDVHMLQLMAPTIISKYKRGLLESEELRNAKDNKKNFDLGTAAIQKGEMVDPVEVEYEGGTKETVPWIEAVDLHNNGAIKKLPFKSSMPMAEISPLKFLSIEMPTAEAKYKGKVSFDFVADIIQAENPRYSREQALAQAKLYADPSMPGATHFLWGRVQPHGSGSSDYWAQQRYLDKLQSVKSITDNLHRAMFDPSQKTTYDPVTKAFNLNNSPFDLSKLRKGTGKGVSEAVAIQVSNNTYDPSKSRFVVKYADGEPAEELTFDDLAQRILGSSNMNIGDYTSLMQMINGGATAIYDPVNYSAYTPSIPFQGVTGFDRDAPDVIKQDPMLYEAWKKKYSGRKTVSYGNNAAAPATTTATELEDIPYFSPPK